MNTPFGELVSGDPPCSSIETDVKRIYGKDAVILANHNYHIPSKRYQVGMRHRHPLTVREL